MATLQIGSLIFLRVEVSKDKDYKDYQDFKDDKDQRIGMVATLYLLAFRVGDWIGNLGGSILYESTSFEGSALAVFFFALIEVGGLVYLKHRT